MDILLDIIHGHFKHKGSENGFCLCLLEDPILLGSIDGATLSPIWRQD
jgi:hypothetical protein